MYKELLSFVTTYKRFFLSSISMPAGEILLGHLSPSFKLSLNINLFFLIAYFKIQLLLTPEAYRNFSFALNFKPSQHSSTTILSSIFPEATSINCMLCVLWPLLVTAINFFESLTAIFNGRSPSRKPLPAGERLHPFGSVIFDGDWALN